MKAPPSPCPRPAMAAPALPSTSPQLLLLVRFTHCCFVPCKRTPSCRRLRQRPHAKGSVPGQGGPWQGMQRLTQAAMHAMCPRAASHRRAALWAGVTWYYYTWMYTGVTRAVQLHHAVPATMQPGLVHLLWTVPGRATAAMPVRCRAWKAKTSVLSSSWCPIMRKQMARPLIESCI